MQRTRTTAAGPFFLVDNGDQRRLSGRQVDWSRVPESRRHTAGQVVRLNGAVLAGATAITVDALAGALEDNTVLDFGGGAFARVNNAAGYAAGATAITVDALPTNIADNAEATVAGSGGKFLRAGTVVSEVVTGNVRKIYPRIGAGAGAGSTVGVLVSDANEDSEAEALSGYGVISQALVYENLLPDSAGGPPPVMDATVRAELVALGFTFERFTDSASV